MTWNLAGNTAILQGVSENCYFAGSLEILLFCRESARLDRSNVRSRMVKNFC
jgi:hypothetical protein